MGFEDFNPKKEQPKPQKIEVEKGAMVTQKLIEEAQKQRDAAKKELETTYKPKAFYEYWNNVSDGFDEIAGVLGSISTSSVLKGPYDIRKRIDTKIDQEKEKLAIASDYKKEFIQDEIKTLMRARDFVNKNIPDKIREDAQKEAWKNIKMVGTDPNRALHPIRDSSEELPQTEVKRKPETKPNSDSEDITKQKNEAERKAKEQEKKKQEEQRKSDDKKKIDEIHENMEKSEKQELMNAVLKDGGIWAQMSVSPNKDLTKETLEDPQQRFGNDPGLKYLNNSKRIDRSGDSEVFYTFASSSDGRNFLDHDAFARTMEANKINEAITLVPKQKDTYKEIEELGPPEGLLRKRKLIKKTEKLGTRPALHSELVKGGKNEPAYELRYKVFDDDSQSPDGLAYKDYSHREQVFELKITLPESEAKKVLEQIKKDPSFMHEIAEKVALEQVGIKKERWDGDDKSLYPLRPPYEEWRKRHGGKSKVLFHEPNKPIDLKSVVEF